MSAAEMILLGFFLIFAIGLLADVVRALKAGIQWTRKRRMIRQAENFANGVSV